MSVDLWNVFHDGGIANLEWSGADALVTVEIDYLRGMFSIPGNEFIVRLHGCEKFEYVYYDGAAERPGNLSVEKEQPQILQARETQDGVRVQCLEGHIHMRYQSFSIFLEDLTPISLTDLFHAAETYWTSFKNRQ